jgi:hypothetical protein
MMGKGSGSGDQTTQFIPPDFIQGQLPGAVRAAGDNFNAMRDRPLFPGDTVAQFNPIQTDAINDIANFGSSPANQFITDSQLSGISNLQNPAFNPNLITGAQTQAGASDVINNLFGGFGVTPQGTAPTAAEGLGNFDISGALNANLSNQTNPFIQQVVQQALQANTQNFLEQALPAIQSEASLGGGFGGSRQGIAEGLGLGRLAGANAQTAVSALSNQFNQDLARRLAAAELGGNLAGQAGTQQLARQQQENDFALNAGALDLNAMLQAAGLGVQSADSGTGDFIQGQTNAGILAPQAQSSQLAGPQAAFAAGSDLQAMDQTNIQADIDRFNAPFARQDAATQNYINQVIGLSGLGGTQTSTGPGGPGALAGAVGGGAAGASIASLAGLGFTASNPIGWIVMGAGALLGALSSD